MATTNLPRVPEGLRDLMKAYTKEVLREKPTNLYEFSSNFFERIAAGKKHYKVLKYEPPQSYEIIMKNRVRQQIPLSVVYNIIPDNLTELIKKFIKAVLKENPENLLVFAIEYFHKLRSIKSPKIEYNKYTAYEQCVEKSGKNSTTRKETCICGRRLNGKAEESDTQIKVENTEISQKGNQPLDGNLSVNYLQAVCTIQKYFRQYLKHKKGKTEKVPSKTTDFHKSQDYFNAVLIIQRHFRLYLERKRAKTKAQFKIDSYHSAEYIRAVSIIQRYCRRYLDRKNQEKPKENAGDIQSDRKVSMTTAAFVIQRAFRRMVRARRAKKHIQAEPDDDVNDNASEAASYTSASTALLSTESTVEHNEFGGNNYEEGVHQQTIQEDEEVDNDNVNQQNEYKTKAIKSSGKSISSNGNDANFDDLLSDSQIDEPNNEKLGILNREKTRKDIFTDLGKHSGEVKVKENETSNENIINNFIKAESMAILSNPPVNTNISEEEVVEKIHKRNIASSLETALPTTVGKNFDIVSADAEEQFTQGNDFQNDKSNTIPEVESSSNLLTKSNNDVEQGTSEISKHENYQEVEVSGMSTEYTKSSNSSTESEKRLGADISEGSVVQIEKPPEETRPLIDGFVGDSDKEPDSELATYQEELLKETENLTVAEKTISSDTPKGSVEAIESPPDEITPQNYKLFIDEANKETVSQLITNLEGSTKEAESSDTVKGSLEAIENPPGEINPLNVGSVENPDVEPVSELIVNQEALSKETEKPIVAGKILSSDMLEEPVEATENSPEEMKPLNDEFVGKSDKEPALELKNSEEGLSKESERPNVLEKELRSDILKRSVEESEISPEQIKSQHGKEPASERTISQKGLPEEDERPTVLEKILNSEGPVESVEATVDSLEEIKPLNDEFVGKPDKEPMSTLPTYQEELPQEAEKPTVLEQKLSSDMLKGSVDDSASPPEEIKPPIEGCGGIPDEPILKSLTNQEELLEAVEKPSVKIEQQDGKSISKPEQDQNSHAVENETLIKPMQDHTSYDKLDDINESSKTETKPYSDVDDKVLNSQKSTEDLEKGSTLNNTNRSNTDTSEAVSEADGSHISQPENVNSVEVNSLQSVLSTLKTNHVLDKENLQKPKSPLISTTEEETSKLEKVSSSTAEALSHNSSTEYEYPEIIKAQIHKTVEETTMQDISLEELGKSIIIHSVLLGEDDYVLPISTDATTNPDSQTVITEELHSTNTLKEDVLTDKTNDINLNSDKPKETVETKEIPLNFKQSSLGTSETIEAPIIKETNTKNNMLASKSPRELGSSLNASEKNDKDINKEEDQPAFADSKTLPSSFDKINEQSPQNLENKPDKIILNTDFEATESAPLAEHLDPEISIPDTKDNSNTDKVEESEEVNAKINEDVLNKSTDKTLSQIPDEDSSVRSNGNEQIAMTPNTNLTDDSDDKNLNKENEERFQYSKEVDNEKDSTEMPSLSQSENQESYALLEEDVQTLEKENLVKNSNLKKRYINEETGEYTYCPEEVSKPENLKNKEKDAIDTEIIKTLFKEEEEKLLSSNKDKADKDNNADDITNSDNIELTPENTSKTSQIMVDPIKLEDETPEPSDMTGESLQKVDEENSNVENVEDVRSSQSLNDDLKLDTKIQEKKSPLHLSTELSDTQAKKIPIAKEKQIPISQSGRLVNAPIAELQLKSFKSSAGSGPWYAVYNESNVPQSDETDNEHSKDMNKLSNEHTDDNPNLPLTPSHKYEERISNYMYGEEVSSQERTKPKQSIAFFVSFDGDDGKTSFKIPKKFLSPNPKSADKTPQKNAIHEDIDFQHEKEELEMDAIITEEDDDDIRYTSQYGPQKLQTIHELNETESSNELKPDVDRSEDIEATKDVNQEWDLVAEQRMDNDKIDSNEATKDGNQKVDLVAEQRMDNDKIDSNELTTGEGTSKIVKENKTDHPDLLKHVRSVQIIERAYKNYIAQRNMNLKLKTQAETNENEISIDIVKNDITDSAPLKYKTELTENLAASRIQKAVRLFLLRAAEKKDQNTDFKDKTYSTVEVSAAKRIQNVFRNYSQLKKKTNSKQEVTKEIKNKNELKTEIPKHIGESKSLDALVDQTESIFGETNKEVEPNSTKPEWFVGSQRISLESNELVEDGSISPGVDSDVDSNARMLEYTHDTQTESPIVGTQMGLLESKLIPDIGNIVDEFNTGKLVAQDNGDSNNSAGSTSEEVLDLAKHLTVPSSSELGIVYKVDASTRQMLNEFLNKEIEYCSAQEPESQISEQEKSQTEVDEQKCIKKSVSLTTDQDLETEIGKTEEENVEEQNKHNSEIQKTEADQDLETNIGKTEEENVEEQNKDDAETQRTDVDQDLETDIGKTEDENVEEQNKDDAETQRTDADALEEAALKLSKPDEVIEKMSIRRSAELRERRKDDFVVAEPSFDEPIIRPMSSLQEQSSLDIEDGDIIVYNRLQRDDTRESSAQSESVVFGTEDEDKVIDVETTRTQLARHYTIAGDDPHVIFRSVTIDENVKYIEDGNDESLGEIQSNNSFCLDDETSENIRKKIMAYSLSEGDSDYFDPNKVVNDDIHIDTAMTDAMDTSTETESTIVSAATKIQAGARGFLARRRLRRASAGTNASTMDTKASFGNDAISESLERFIEEEAAKKIQVAYRLHSRKQKKQTKHLKSASLESSLAAKRLTLQRGDALRNDSNTTPEDENSENASNGQQKVTESKRSKATAEGRDRKKPGVGLSWLPRRQNSMPVQIDCEVMRPIPKHMRKRIKSAENEKRKTRK